jgi:hypothetical protein
LAVSRVLIAFRQPHTGPCEFIIMFTRKRVYSPESQQVSRSAGVGIVGLDWTTRGVNAD